MSFVIQPSSFIITSLPREPIPCWLFSTQFNGRTRRLRSHLFTHPVLSTTRPPPDVKYKDQQPGAAIAFDRFSRDLFGIERLQLPTWLCSCPDKYSTSSFLWPLQQQATPRFSCSLLTGLLLDYRPSFSTPRLTPSHLVDLRPLPVNIRRQAPACHHPQPPGSSFG